MEGELVVVVAAVEDSHLPAHPGTLERRPTTEPKKSYAVVVIHSLDVLQ